MITNNDRCSQSEKSQDYSPQSPQREGNHNSTPVKPSQANSPQANDRKQTQPWNNLGEKQLWDWLELLIAPGLIAVLTVVGSFGWNVISDRITAQRYREGLVKDYIEAVKVLLLDDYHKTGNNPEIRVEEVEAFVRSKTASTLRAINADGGDGGDPKQTTADWINFLKEAGITNAGWINFLKEAGIINADGGDPKQTAVLINFLKEAGILKETGIEIEFFSSYNPINFLQEADWINFLKEAGITNADLSDFLKEAGTIAGIINADGGDPKQTAVLINFLKEAGIGFISSDSANSRSEGIQTNKNQDICTEDAIALTKQPKNVIFSHFLCRIDLSGIKLNQSNLQSIILEDANLYRAELNNTQLFFADLERANLNEAQLQDANLSRANLRQAFLMSANLKDATLRGANLREADLSQRGSSPTNLSHAVLQGANLTKATLTNVDLSGADLSPMGLVEKAINLNPTNLRDANLEKAKLNGTNLTMANLRGANLNQASWDETTRFEQAIYDQYTCFPESFEFKDKKMRFIPSGWDKKKIQNCKNRRTPKHQETIDLKDADLRGADLREANLEHANLIGAKLRKADLRGANLEQAEFSPETCVINALYPSFVTPGEGKMNASFFRVVVTRK